MFRRKTFKALAVFLLPIFIINNAAMAQGMLGKGAQSFEISEINEENLSPYIISKALSDDEKGGALVERTTNISRWSIRQEIKIFFERGEEYARTELQLDVDDAAMRRILWAAYEITYKSAMKNAGRGGDIIRAAVLEGKFKIAEKAYQDAYAQSVASQPADPRSIFSALESGIGAKNTDSEPETSFFNFEQRDTISRNSPTGNPNIDNIHRMYEAVEKNKGYKVVIIACPNEDMANFWQNRLDSLKGRIIGTETLVYAIPFPPDWNGAGGQVLVTLYCWQEAIRRAKGAGVDIEEIKRSDKDSIAVYHTIGKGTRTYPAPAVEVNAKSAVNVPALVVIDEENKNMMMLEAVIFATQILAESRENRLSNFWTDHFVIPSGDMKSPNTHHVEMMSIDHKIPAQNNEKAWQQDELDQYGLLIHNYPEKGDVQVKEKFTHQEAVEHLYPLADGAPREDGIQAGEVHGISLGSHSISWEFVETLEAYHGQELAEHRGFVNTDPDIWQPMSSDQTQFIKRFEKNDVPNDQNQAYLDAGSRYDEMQRLKQDFLDARELVRDERRMIGYVETGLNTWSWDFGKVIDLVHNFSKMTEGSPQAQGMRLFFGDSQVIDREHIGEVYVENSIYIGNDIKKGWVRNSIVVNTRATELNAENAIVIDGRAFRLDAKDNSFAYRVLHPGVLRLEKDEVAATVAQPGRGMFLLKTDTSRAGDKDWAVELPFNLFTYEEVYNGNQSYPMKEMEHFRETYGKFFFGIFREYRHWLTDAVSKQEQVTIDDRIGAMREIFVRGLEAIKPSRALELLLWAETLQYMPEIKISAKEAVARIFRTDIHPLDDIFDAQAEAFVNNANSECIQQGLASEDESRKSPTAGTSDEAPTATFEVNGTTVQNVPIVGGTLTDTLEDLGLAAEAIYANPEDNAVLVNGTAVTGNVRLNKNDVVTINYLSPLAFLRGPDNPDGQHFYLDDYPPSPEAINVRILVAGMMGITTNLIIFEQAAASGQFDDAIGAQVAAGNEDPADVYDKVTMPAFAEYAEVIGANTTDGDGKVKGTASYEVRPNDLHDPVATARQQIAITALEPDTAMHKTPSTAAGLAAILANMFDKILTRDNMTLMFGFDQWLESQYTQIEKLEERVKRGLPVDKYFGVDSFFVSRTDLLISAIFDRLIAQGIVSGKDKEAFESVRNLVAVSMGKRVAEWNEYVYSPAYALPKETLPEDYRKLDVLRRRFNAVNKACQARFGHTIRPRVPLWASTLAKPAQEKQGVDILIYAVNLMGRNSVDTMPGALVKAIERRFAGMTNEEKKRAMRALDNAALDERIITQYRPDGDHTYADKTAPEVLEIINDLLTKYSGAILGVTGTHPFKERADESIRDEIAAYNESLKQLRDEGVLPDDLYQQERVPIEDDYFLVTLDVLARLLTWTGGDQFIKAYNGSLETFRKTIERVKAERRQSPTAETTLTTTDRYRESKEKFNKSTFGDQIVFGTSGIREVVKFLEDIKCYAIARSIASYFKSMDAPDAVALASDLRMSSPRIALDMVLGNLEAGREVIWAGNVPTPAVVNYGMHRLLGAISSVMITASHCQAIGENEMNGGKPNVPDGEVLKDDERLILNIVREELEIQYMLPEADSLFDADGALKNKDLSGEQDELVRRAIEKLNEIEAEVREMYISRYADSFGRIFGETDEFDFIQHMGVGREIIPELLGERMGATLNLHTWQDNWVDGYVVDTEDIQPGLQDDVDTITAANQAAASSSKGLFTTDGDGDRPALFQEDGEFVYGDKLGYLTCEYIRNLNAYRDTNTKFFVAVTATVSDAVVRRLESLRFEVVKVKIGSPYVVKAMLDRAIAERAAQAEAAGENVICMGFERNGGFLLGSDIVLDSGKTLKRLPTRDAMLPVIAAMHTAKLEGRTVKEVFEDRFSGEFASFGWSGLIEAKMTNEAIWYEFVQGDQTEDELEADSGMNKDSWTEFIKMIFTFDLSDEAIEKAELTLPDWFVPVRQQLFGAGDANAVSAQAVPFMLDAIGVADPAQRALVAEKIRSIFENKTSCDKYTAGMGQAIMRSFSPINLDITEVEFRDDGTVRFLRRGVKEFQQADDEFTAYMKDIKERLERHFGDKFSGDISRINYLDGVRMFFRVAGEPNKSEIIHMRPSGNSPQWRIYSEAATLKRAKQITRYRLPTYSYIIEEYLEYKKQFDSMRIVPQDNDRMKANFDDVAEIIRDDENTWTTFGYPHGSWLEHYTANRIIFGEDNASVSFHRTTTYNIESDPRLARLAKEGYKGKELSVTRTITWDRTQGTLTCEERWSDGREVSVVYDAPDAWLEIARGLDKNIPMGKFQNMPIPVMPDAARDHFKSQGINWLDLFDVSVETEFTYEAPMWERNFDIKKPDDKPADGKTGPQDAADSAAPQADDGKRQSPASTMDEAGVHTALKLAVTPAGADNEIVIPESVLKNFDADQRSAFLLLSTLKARAETLRKQDPTAKLVIAIEPDWLPGYESEYDKLDNRAGLNGFMSQIDRLDSFFSDEYGLGNIEIVRGSGADLIAKVRELTGGNVNHTYFLAGKTNALAGTYDTVTAQGAKLTGIDNKLLMEEYEDAQWNDEDLLIRVVDMINIAVRSPNAVPAEMRENFEIYIENGITFLAPRAERVKIDLLPQRYQNILKALVAA